MVFELNIGPDIIVQMNKKLLLLANSFFKMSIYAPKLDLTP